MNKTTEAPGIPPEPKTHEPPLKSEGITKAGWRFNNVRQRCPCHTRDKNKERDSHLSHLSTDRGENPADTSSPTKLRRAPESRLLGSIAQKGKCESRQAGNVACALRPVLPSALLSCFAPCLVPWTSSSTAGPWPRAIMCLWPPISLCVFGSPAHDSKYTTQSLSPTHWQTGSPTLCELASHANNGQGLRLKVRLKELLYHLSVRPYTA
ncbi:hypothetical protein BDW74DRAFT_94266 [Aspergillus multicolor]|uniref:uncharacterized protein n=1 Tax=Aspergillus multicolor TaxID=41759 RepID=UPI003CCD2446